MKCKPTAEIARRNWQDTRAYLDYCTDIRQCAEKSGELYRCQLDHLLRWATSITLLRAADLRPTFPAYLTALNLSVNYT